MSESLGALDAFYWKNYLSDEQMEKGINAASLTLLAFDCLTTLPDEVQHVWHSRMSIVKVLYFATRYMGLSDTVVIMFFSFHSGLDPSMCRRLQMAQSWLVLSGMIVAELIMAIRTYALCRQSHILGSVLYITGIVTIFGSIIAEYFSTQELAFQSSPAPNIVPCVSVTTKEKDWIALLLLVLFELVVLVLTLWKTAIRVNNQRSPLLHIFYTDGLIYFIASLAISVSNIILLRVSNVNLISMQRVLHSNLSSRIILRIRAISATSLVDSQSEITTIRCALPCKSGRSSSESQPGGDHGTQSSFTLGYQITADQHMLGEGMQFTSV